jgi:hypothetical protein
MIALAIERETRPFNKMQADTTHQNNLNAAPAHAPRQADYDEINEVNNDGRKLELTMNGDAGLTIPVSTSFKNSTLERLHSLGL